MVSLVIAGLTGFAAGAAATSDLWPTSPPASVVSHYCTPTFNDETGREMVEGLGTVVLLYNDGTRRPLIDVVAEEIVAGGSAAMITGDGYSVLEGVCAIRR